MSDVPGRTDGITMLDGAALVTGAAVASVHFRELTTEMEGLTLLGWLFLCLAFLWLALTAAGPFVFVVRRFASRPVGYPSFEDRLWLGFGLPWLATALYRSAQGNSFDSTNQTYGYWLFAGLFLASAPALVRLSQMWSKVTLMPSGPKRAESWTDLIGRTVSVTWPLQFGLGFVVTR